MEFFTLNPIWDPFENPSTLYAKDALIDEYESAIWTERFSKAGDVTIVLEATEERIAQLAPGTLLGLQELSHQIMLLDTRVIKDGLLTVTGKTVEAFFNNRYVSAAHYRLGPQNIIWEIFKNMQQRYRDRAATYFVTPAMPQVQSFVTYYGESDTFGDVNEDISFGPAYEQMERIATQYFVGMGVFWRFDTDNVPNVYVLDFETWTGDDKTRDRAVYELPSDELELVQFSPALDNFANVQELLSEAEHKNVVVALPPPGLSVSAFVQFVEVSKIPVEEQRDRPFSTRVKEILCDNITEADLGTGDQQSKIDELRRLLEVRAKEELSKDTHKKIRVIDGEFTPTANEMYRYTSQGHWYDARPFSDTVSPGVIRYGLGDLVEVQGHYGGVQKVRVTEFIRSKDASGVKAYPTLVKDSEPLGTTTVVA